MVGNFVKVTGQEQSTQAERGGKRKRKDVKEGKMIRFLNEVTRVQKENK